MNKLLKASICRTANSDIGLSGHLKLHYNSVRYNLKLKVRVIALSFTIVFYNELTNLTFK